MNNNNFLFIAFFQGSSKGLKYVHFLRLKAHFQWIHCIEMLYFIQNFQFIALYNCHWRWCSRAQWQVFLGLPNLTIVQSPHTHHANPHAYCANPHTHCANPHTHCANHENHYIMKHARYRRTLFLFHCPFRNIGSSRYLAPRIPLKHLTRCNTTHSIIHQA
jgi:hypothetical protein